MNARLFIMTMTLIAVAVSAHADGIFDSMAEFSGTQGQDGWYYGYYDGDSASPYTYSDFEEMPQFINDNQWIILRGVPSGYWTSLYATGGHPNGPVGNYYQGTEHWAVRRWISDVAGTIQLDGNLANTDLQGYVSDGIIGHISVNNNTVFSQQINAHDNIGVNYSIQVEVNVGDTIDFAIQPGANDRNDSTRFTATGTVIPEPLNAALLFSLWPLLIIRRMFSY